MCHWGGRRTTAKLRFTVLAVKFLAGVSYVAPRQLHEISVYLTHLSAKHTAVCSWKYIPLFENRGDSYHFIRRMYFYVLLEKLKTTFPTTDSRE